MFVQLADHLVVVNGVDQVSQPFEMGDMNTVRGQITVIGNTATSLTVNIQGSNDLQNWNDSTADTGFVFGTAPTANRAISYTYARMKFIVVGTGTILVNANANTSHV